MVRKKENDLMGKLDGKKILIFAEDMFEDLELLYPKIRLTEEGADVTVAGKEKDLTVTGKNGHPVTTDVSWNNVEASDYDALVIPGGYGPDKLRRHDRVIELTKQFNDSKKLIAFICHAGWVPISAGIVKGKKLTSFFSIKDDLVNAGAEWKDESMVEDGNFISSRNPGDLPDFCKGIINYLST